MQMGMRLGLDMALKEDRQSLQGIGESWARGQQKFLGSGARGLQNFLGDARISMCAIIRTQARLPVTLWEKVT